MSYNLLLVERIRKYLSQFSKLKVEEKKMFGGVCFMVNDKMCVCGSGENLMCRFDPDLTEEIAQRKGYLPMIMKGKELKGYCYVEETGYAKEGDFKFWVDICLEFNGKAQSSKKRKKETE